MDPEALLAILVAWPPAWVWLALALGAFVEYVFPPFPGDTVVVVGAVWTGATGASLWPVWLAVTVGAVAGTTANWWMGRKAANHLERLSESNRARVDRLVLGFERYGAPLLVLNRFVPGVRALFFVAAGVAGLRLWVVVGWAMVSALLWNAALLGIGTWVGWNLEALLQALQRVGFAVVGGLALVVLVGWDWSRRRTPT
jgi:membrane protein DedA with SNARE-associated domain